MIRSEFDAEKKLLQARELHKILAQYNTFLKQGP